MGSFYRFAAIASALAMVVLMKSGSVVAADANKTITFGMSAPLTGGVATQGLDALKGSQVFIKYLNDNGGVNGYKWDLVAQDDALDPQKALASIQYLVSEKKVFGLWGDFGSQQVVALPFIAKTKTPFLFVYGINPAFHNPMPPTTFMIIPQGYDEEKAMSDYLGTKLTGDHVFGLLPLNNDAGEDFTKGFKAGAAGKWVKSVQPFESTTTTWQTQLVALRAAGVTDIMIHGADAWTAKIIGEAKRLGMQNVKFYANTSTATPKFFQLAGENAQGTLAVTFSSPPDDESVPGVAKFLAAFAKYEPGYKPGTAALHNWVTGLIIAEAMKHISGEITQEKLIDALEQMRNFDTGDIIPPVSFSKDNHLGTAGKVRILEASDGHWKAVSGWVGGK